MAELEVRAQTATSLNANRIAKSQTASFAFVYSAPSCINACRLHKVNWEFIELENIQCCDSKAFLLIAG